MCDLRGDWHRTCEKEAKDVFIFSPIFETVEEAVQVRHRGWAMVRSEPPAHPPRPPKSTRIKNGRKDKPSIHCKKMFNRMSLTKLSLAGNDAIFPG